MTGARFLLYLGSVAALSLALRSVLVGPIPLELACALLLAYVGFVITGVLVPRLEMFGEVTWRGPAGEPRVALTFDDGPDPETTPLVLAELARSGARATFFVLGEKAERSPEMLCRIRDGGHELAVHGYRHHLLYGLLSPARVADDVGRAVAAIEKAAGVRPVWFRPPVGQVSPRTFAGARRAGVSVAGWSVRGRDGVASAVAGNVARRVVRGLEPGAVVLLHDAAERGGRVPASIPALPEILRALSHRGLSSVPLSELVQPGAGPP